VSDQSLIANVEQFKVFYGYDDSRAASAALSTINVNQPSALSVRDAAFINGVGPRGWDFVVSVYVCFVIRSDASEQSVVSSGNYQACPKNAAEASTGTVLQPQTDGILRRSYAQVFTVRARSSFNPLL
jgi:hypothetical protein